MSAGNRFFTLCVILVKNPHYQSEEDPVDIKKLENNKELLLKHRQQILNGILINKSDDLHVSTEYLTDETDLASSLIQQQLDCTIRDREYAKRRKSYWALEKINDWTYGHCEECAEEIGLK